MPIQMPADSGPAAVAESGIPPVTLWNVPLHAISSEESLAEIILHAQRRTPFAVEYVAVNNLVNGVLDPAFRAALSRFDLLLADGKPVYWTLKYLLRETQSEHTTAREQMLSVCSVAAQNGLSVCLYGSTEATLARLSRQLLQRFSGLEIAMQRASVFRALSHDELDCLIEEFNASGAHIIFVALGCPLQEHFVATIRDRVRAVCVCVGSAFEIHAGIKHVPPVWITDLGMEWCYRLLQDPRRLWKRYIIVNTVFVALLARSVFRRLVRKVTVGADHLF